MGIRTFFFHMMFIYLYIRMNTQERDNWYNAFN